MSFAPVIPGGGLTGWAFLSRTLAAQKKAFATGAQTRGDEEYFRDRIGAVGSADALLGDRRLLSVALTAFGLEGDLNNRAFLRKVLEDGTLSPGALANRLADKRYLEFARAFGFGDLPVPNTKKSDFADKVLGAYEAKRFEAAVGQVSGDMRLALNARSELAAIAGRSLSADGKWYAAMGSPPLRQVLQTAFGLPSSFVSVDIDRQLAILKARAGAALGESGIEQFADPARVDRIVRLFLLRSAAAGGATSPALSLLQGTDRTGLSLSRYA
ncbi:MAG: DUF1217 domain-containing protein [Proteobacteria bacterium]|nr:DUF1217 domain-containing protein [Pseudomonadota bacterium]MBS0572875.1 DUF1217 domain-containing protein [Pseudomonadota bacterium]